MSAAVHDFPSINRKLRRMEQKAEFDAKNPKPEPSAYDALSDGMFGMGTPLKSLAHPNWPYTGTPHEWTKFKI